MENTGNSRKAENEIKDNIISDKYKLKSNAVDDRLNIAGAANGDITDPIGIGENRKTGHESDIEDVKLTRDDD